MLYYPSLLRVNIHGNIYNRTNIHPNIGIRDSLPKPSHPITVNNIAFKMEDQLCGQAESLPAQVRSTHHSSNTHKSLKLSDIPALLSTSNASLYENRIMQRAPTILNFHSLSLPPSIRPSVVPAVPSIILSAQQYQVLAGKAEIKNTSKYISLPHLGHQFAQINDASQYPTPPHPDHLFLPPQTPCQQFTTPIFIANGTLNTSRTGFVRDQDALAPDMKSRLPGDIEEAFSTLAEVYPMVLQIFIQGFDHLRDIITSIETIPSTDEALCAQFIVDDSIEGIQLYTGPGRNQEVISRWKFEYDLFQQHQSEMDDRNLSIPDMLTSPPIPSPVPYHIHARNPLWQGNTLRNLQCRRVTIIKHLRIIRNSMILPDKGKDVFPLPEMGFGNEKKCFDENEDYDWPTWDILMGGLGFQTCVKEELEHWTKLWEAFSVELEVAKRAAERKKTLGRLWGPSAAELGKIEVQNGNGMGVCGS